MASSTPYPVEHSFSDGLLTDLPATQTPRTALTGGQNMHLLNDGQAGEQQILQTDRGNRYVAGLPVGWVIMGGESLSGIEYLVLGEVVGGVATGRGQIGTFPSPEPDPSGDPDLPPPATGRLLPRYRPLHNFQPYLGNTPPDPTLYPLVADEFNFSLQYPVQVELQPDYDGTVNVIFNDESGVNPPRIVNSRFAQQPGSRYRIIDRTGQRDSNLYSPASFGDTMRLFQRSRSLVKAEFLGLLDGGQVGGGSWTYYFAYVNQDGQATDVVAWTPAIPVFDGNHLGTIQGTSGTTNRRVSLSLSGLDAGYQFLRVYAVRASGLGGSEAIEAQQLVPDLRLVRADGTLSFSHTGYEKTLPYDQASLSLHTGSIETFTAMSQVDNMLAFVGGKTSVYDDQALRDFASQVQCSAARRALQCPGIVNDGQTMGTGRQDPFTAQDFATADGDGRLGGYLNPWNVAYRLGYGTGEAYGFGIVFRLASGADSAVFPLRGHDHLLLEEAYDPATVFDADGWAASGENLDGVFRFPQINSYVHGTLLDGQGRVTIFGVDFALPQVPAAVRAAAVGAYFVRLKRNPDRVAQGYGVAVATSLIQARDNEPWDHFSDQVAFMEAPGYGKAAPNMKCLPAPAAILETAVSHIDSKENERHVLAFEFPRQLDGHRYIVNPWRLAFYSPDAVANPARVRSALQGRALRMSHQGTVLARATTFTENPSDDGRTTFKVWKTVAHVQDFTAGVPRVKGYWTDGGVPGANDGAFGSQEKYLAGKGHDDVRFLVQTDFDDYVGLVATNLLDDGAGGAYQAITNAQGSFGPNGGHQISGGPGETPIQTYLAGQRPVAWLLNLYPEHASDDQLAAQTMGARPRDVLRDLYSIDTDGYFPISPLLSWDELEGQLDYQRHYTCFGGDTFKGMSYRRLYTALRAGEATTDVRWTEQHVGQVLSLVAESDVNPYAGRLREQQARPGEGAPRSWWAAAYEDAGRDAWLATSDSFKALETAGYNAGFGHTSGFTLQLTLPRNVPFRAVEFPNQVAVTSVHLPGGYQNGYRQYLPGSAQTYRRDLGSMVGVRTQGRSLVIALERGVIVVAVNERTQAGADGGGPTFLEVRQVLSPYCQVLSQTVGAYSQHAMVATDQAVYGLDAAGFWRVQGGDFALLSSLRVDRELLPWLRQLGSERADQLLRRMVRLGLDVGRGDVLLSVVSNQWQALAAEPVEPPDPYQTPGASDVPAPPLPASPFEPAPAASLLYRWDPALCQQLVYSYRLDKWLPAQRYGRPAQFFFSLGRQLYSVPLPDAHGAGRSGVFLHEGNPGVYYDELAACAFEFVVTGSSGERVQSILNNLVLLTNEALPLRLTYQPLDKLETEQLVVGPASGNIALRNAEYREDRALITVPPKLSHERQRARAIRVRVEYLRRDVVRVGSVLAWLADSFA